MLVDEEGSRLGQFATEDALQLARDRGLDLVEVSANAKPPVCRIADYGKLRYERKKKQAATRRKSRSSQLKELKLRPKTDDHDLDVKARRAREFLLAGDRVKLTVRFRGREHAHRDIGADQIRTIASRVADLARLEAPPRMEGRQLVGFLVPTNPNQEKSH